MRVIIRVVCELMLERRIHMPIAKTGKVLERVSTFPIPLQIPE
jgi:hypothetical protein